VEATMKGAYDASNQSNARAHEKCPSIFENVNKSSDIIWLPSEFY
jgi:hypothetical protein